MTTPAQTTRDAYEDPMTATYAEGSDIVGATQTRRAQSRFAPIETLLTELDSHEAVKTRAA